MRRKISLLSLSLVLKQHISNINFLRILGWLCYGPDMYLYDTMIIIINKEPINHVLGTRQKVNRAGDIRTVNEYVPIFSTLQLLLENDTVIAEVVFV